MRLMACRGCELLVRLDERVCPHCGARRARALGAVAAVAMSASLAGCIGGTTEPAYGVFTTGEVTTGGIDDSTSSGTEASIEDSTSGSSSNTSSSESGSSGSDGSSSSGTGTDTGASSSESGSDGSSSSGASAETDGPGDPDNPDNP